MIMYTNEHFVPENALTKDMIGPYNEFRAMAEEEYLYCDAQFKKYSAIDTSLPQTRADGKPLTHGDRMIMKTIAEYWEVRRDAIKHHLSREWVVEHGGNPHLYKI